MEKTFDTTGAIGVRIRLPAGDVRIVAEGTARTVVTLVADDEAGEDLVLRTRVQMQGDELIVDVPERGSLFGDTPELGLHVRCPQGSRLAVSVASADVEVLGQPAGVELKSASGDIHVERVEGETGVHTASGDVRLGYCGGVLELGTASGDLTVDQASRGLTASLVSGDLHVGRVDGVAELSTVSGDVRIDDIGPGAVRGHTVSGDVRLCVRPGCDVWMDIRSLSGDTSSGLETLERPAADRSRLVELVLSSVSGDVRIERAQTVAA